MAVPSEYCRALFAQVAVEAPSSALVVSATKGLELDTLLRMSEVAAAEAPGRAIAVLSGPSFALEVARQLPTAVVVASADHAVAERVQRALSTRSFRVYSSEDTAGVELAGAVKNVIAIAAGIVDGLGFGHNTVAALITRGLAEISRLAVALGGRPDTLAGLAGLGDLVLTCTGSLSRNRTLGQRLGRGQSLAEAGAGLHPEGVRTTLATALLAERHGIDMPIVRQMRAVLYQGKPVARGARRADAAEPQKGVNCRFQGACQHSCGGIDVPADLPGRRHPAELHLRSGRGGDRPLPRLPDRAARLRHLPEPRPGRRRRERRSPDHGPEVQERHAGERRHGGRSAAQGRRPHHAREVRAHLRQGAREQGRARRGEAPLRGSRHDHPLGGRAVEAAHRRRGPRRRRTRARLRPTSRRSRSRTASSRC